MALPATLDGRYRVLQELARGGMGVVYLVEHVVTGKRHAAKVMLAEYSGEATWRERFLREARAGVRVDSEHVVEISDAGVAPELGGSPFLIMELLDGGDLAALLAARGHLAPAEVISLMTQLATVLDRAHALGIVHRDLKPGNLFIHKARDGRQILKVLDFGLVTALGDLFDAQHLTRTGAIMGTVHYMAPEQACGDRAAIGPPTDRWAAGMIAFELLSGQHYWGHTTATSVLRELLTGSLPPPSELVPGLGPAFDAWFGRTCHRDPTQRFRSSREQVSALAHALGVTGGYELPPTLNMTLARPMPALTASPTTTPVVRAPVTAPRGHGNVLVILGGIAALLAAITAGVLWLNFTDPPKAKSKAPVADDEDDEDEAPPVSTRTAPRPKGPRVSTYRVTSTDLYDAAAQKTVESHMSEMLACYTEALKRDPKLQGEIELMVTLDENGTVEDGTMCALRPELVSPPDLCRCMAGRLATWRFPTPPDGESASFFYTFNLDP